MSKKQFKSQASSSRAVSGPFVSRGQGFGGLGGSATTTPAAPIFGLSSSPSSPLSYVTEPLDLSGISNPSVVVALKNLSKKDSTTKAKGLEDLQNHVLSTDGDIAGVEDALLQAWIKVYPRTSIDSARRVRQLAHTLQGQIAVSCGKRIARHMPKLVGAWLAGLYDNDRIVANAARDALKNVFPTEEKVRSVWKIYQSAILEYSRNAILRETVQSLSDERTVRLDDAEAKYARVLGTSISVVTNMLAALSEDDTAKEHGLYIELFGDLKLWKFSSHPDAFVRRAVYKLGQAIISRKPADVDFAILSTTLLGEALSVDQTGSTQDYTDTLYILTKTRPEVWTDLYTAKKSVAKGLRQFLKKGSQGGPPAYWSNVERILRNVPSSVIVPTSVGEGQQLSIANDLLESLHDGIIKEAKASLPAAWTTYIAIAVHTSIKLTQDEDRQQLLKTAIIPLFEQFIAPKQDLARWSIGTTPALAAGILTDAFHQTMEVGGYSLLRYEWQRCAELLQDHIKTSHPEQSKDYTRSQDSVVAETNRWSSLTGDISRNGSEIAGQFLEDSSVSLVKVAMEVVKARNGKPYGAAATIEAAMRLMPSMLMENRSTVEAIARFLRNDVPSLIMSPCSPYLITVLCAFEGREGFEIARDEVVQALLRAPSSPGKNIALIRFLTSSCLQGSQHTTELHSLIFESLHKAMKGDQQSWELVVAAFNSPMTPSSLTDHLLTTMTDGLTIDSQASPALHGLRLVTQHSKEAIQNFTRTTEGSNLLPRLLFLTESASDDISQQAATVSVAVESTLSDNKGSSHVTNSLVEIISRELGNAGPSSLSVDSLIDQAFKVLKPVTGEDRAAIAAQLLPESPQWFSITKPFLTIPPDPSLAITNPLGGAVYMVDRSDEKLELKATGDVPRDSNGYSPALRMAIYVSSLIANSDIFELISTEQRTDIAFYLSLLLSLASDNLGLEGANDLWIQYNSEVDDEMTQFVSRTQTLVARWLETTDSPDLRSTTEAGFLGVAGRRLLDRSLGLSATAYNSARAFSAIQSELIELHGMDPKVTMEESVLKTIRKGSDVFHSIALLTGLRPRKDSIKLCNEIIADLTGLRLERNQTESLRQLIILNSILQNQDGIADGIPQQRLVFLTKHFISSLKQETMSPPVIAEILRVFEVVLPIIKGIYGSHWAEILQLLSGLWSPRLSGDGQELPVIHASLRLYMAIKTIIGDDDGNDDLEDAWKECLGALSKGLINLLKQSRAVPDDSNQPLRIVNELLARTMAKVPLEHLEDLDELYPLLYVDSRSVQETAYDVLHKHIPSAQEQISMDMALSKEDAKLPDELLSLVLEAPKFESLADANFTRTMPLDLRGYLFSWKLIFDHFTNASYKVKTDYAENIKSGAYLDGLLVFIFDFLGHSKNKPVDASRFEITSYTPDMEESPQKDTQWLLVHLYYLALRHLPTLSKSWWMGCQNRQTVLAVETWTEKYISPLVIAAELTTVSEWIPTQAADTQALTIKVNQKAKEITAGYEVDDQMMQIALKLPPAYPLHPATVEGINRVGVDEKRWRSWLINIQGVIIFSNGSLIDGLLAYRRNVIGALKGQSECAICYSIISADKQLPSKRCGTCKNTFHSSCLYKWFKSSNSSSCPLCRNAFNYG